MNNQKHINETIAEARSMIKKREKQFNKYDRISGNILVGALLLSFPVWIWISFSIAWKIFLTASFFLMVNRAYEYCVKEAISEANEKIHKIELKNSVLKQTDNQ